MIRNSNGTSNLTTCALCRHTTGPSTRTQYWHTYWHTYCPQTRTEIARGRMEIPLCSISSYNFNNLLIIVIETLSLVFWFILSLLSHWEYCLLIILGYNIQTDLVICYISNNTLLITVVVALYNCCTITAVSLCKPSKTTWQCLLDKHYSSHSQQTTPLLPSPRLSFSLSLSLENYSQDSA